jgi:Cu2+-containing amine oxidase
MPVERVSFELKPENFFDSSPAMDVPPTITKK